MRTTARAVLVLALATFCGCSSSTSSSSKGAKDGGAEDGGAGSGGGGQGGSNAAGGALGAACEKSSDCASGLSCDQEVDNSYPADNLPPGVKEVPSKAYPGGSCTPVPAGAYDPNGVRSCDPLAAQPQQGCGSDGACVAVSVGQQTEVACRPTCNPAAAKNDCGGRFGYTCDFELRACVEGCQSDEECRLQLADSNNDGQPDGLVYDDGSKAVCDTDSFRCVVKSGAANADTGAPCQRLDDCEADGVCVQPLQTYGGMPFPDGYCTKLGCDLSGRECKGDGAVCAPLRSWSPGTVTSSACFQSCEVGAEPEADQLGSGGHGKGCRVGYRCHYNGGNGSAAGSAQGVCVGGNYNDVTDNNLGQSCQSDADCYSPFGLGVCLQLGVGSVQAPTGTCSIFDCKVPGLPDNVCGAGGECIGLNGDVTFCVKTCKDASECADGYACADDDGDATTSKVCYPACFGDEDCRAGTERCTSTSASTAGSCVAS